jgi:hypothetical protein
MGRIITLAMAVLVVTGGTGVVLSSKAFGVHPPFNRPQMQSKAGDLNAGVLFTYNPHSEFDPLTPSVIGSYDAFGGFIADEPGVESASARESLAR